MFDLDSNKKYSIQYSSDIIRTLQYQQYADETWVDSITLDGKPCRVPTGGHKPNGLWYAFGRGWIDFHYSCGKVTDHDLPPLFELEVDTTNFIKLTSPEEIHAFNQEYRVGKEPIGISIDWLAVSQKYDGIEVAPFNRKFSTLYWYRTFDISSGCVWNLNVLGNIRRLH